MTHAPCVRHPLACGDTCLVELCECGAVHLTIGALTLRLRPEALADLAAVINEGARALTLRSALGALGAHRAEALS